MTATNILECVKQLKMKNCEGYDRIPQRILIDGINILLNPLTRIFNLIYIDCQIPEQWLIAKITPIHKKGSKNEIENYRPVATLCSTTKIFERLILILSNLKNKATQEFEIQICYAKCAV